MGINGVYDSVISRELTRRLPRVARCGWELGTLVGVHAEPGRLGYFSGVERCGSIWACAECSGSIRGLRALEVGAAIGRWILDGGQVLMVTLTMPHRRTDRLGATLDVVLESWRRMVSHRPWKATRDALRAAGYVRVVEITHGANGWHPHIHALLFIREPVTDDEVQQLHVQMHAMWQTEVTRQGGGRVHPIHGVRVTRGDAAAGAYLAKVQEHIDPARLAAEVARGDLKAGLRGSRLPYELLDIDEPWARAAWLEYVDDTRGRRCMTWSRGLRELVGLQPEEPDDALVELANSGAPVIFTLTAEEYRALRQSPDVNALTDVLERAEMIALALAHTNQARSVDSTDENSSSSDR